LPRGALTTHLLPVARGIFATINDAAAHRDHDRGAHRALPADRSVTTLATGGARAGSQGWDLEPAHARVALQPESA
jgi:hypothetical protein